MNTKTIIRIIRITRFVVQARIDGCAVSVFNIFPLHPVLHNLGQMMDDINHRILNTSEAATVKIERWAWNFQKRSSKKSQKTNSSFLLSFPTKFGTESIRTHSFHAACTKPTWFVVVLLGWSAVCSRVLLLLCVVEFELVDGCVPKRSGCE